MRRAVVSFQLLALLAASRLTAQRDYVEFYTPPPPTVQTATARQTAGTAGYTTYYYWVVVRYPAGNAVPDHPATVERAGTVGGANSITVNWNPLPGATGYDVLRRTLPWLPAAGGACNCRVALGVAGPPVVDNVAAPVAYTVSAANARAATLRLDNRDFTNPELVLATALSLPVHDRGGAVYNVKAEPYRARGDGVTDDAAAINATITAVPAAGGTAYLPCGTYLVGSIITGKSNLSLIGANRECVTIKAANESNLHRIFHVPATSSNVIVSGITFDGNYRNQSAPGLGEAIFVQESSFVTIADNRFKNCGKLTDISAGFAVMAYMARNVTVRRNEFVSNWAVDVNISGIPSDGAVVEDNVLGTPSLLDAGTVANWWDTRAAGFRGITIIASSGCSIARNQIYGGDRGTSGSFILANPIQLTDITNCVVADNVIDGRGNGYGTLSVIQGNGTIDGTDTYFSTVAAPSVYSDVDNFLVIEGDATLYKITTVNSTVQIVVTPVVVRTTASGLRYRIASTGDLLGAAGLQYTTVVGNTANHGHDNGFSFGESAARAMQYCTIGSNVANYNAAAGFLATGAFAHNTITGNTFSNNGNGVTQINPAALRAGLGLEPTVGLDAITDNLIADNTLSDTRGGSATQVYGIAFNPYAVVGGDAVITAIRLLGNSVSGNTTGDTNKASVGTFLSAHTNGFLGFLPVAFADLGAPANGTFVLCSDCTITNPCAAGGTGVLARRENGVWNCGSTLGNTAALNAAAPGAVPGCSADLTITVTGAVLGDTATVAPPVTIPASFTLTGWVSAANTVSIRWCQLAGAAADPDGGGGTYRADVWKH